MGSGAGHACEAGSCVWLRGRWGERDVDTIGVGHVRVGEQNQGFPTSSPSPGAGLRLAGEPSGDPTSRRGDSLLGSGPWERAGVGGVGLALLELRLGRRRGD